VRTSEVALPTVTTTFLAKPLFAQRPTKTVVLLAISKITIPTIVVTTQAAAAAVLMAVVLTQPHRTVLHMSAVLAVQVAGHTVFVEATAVEVKAPKATGQQVVFLLVPGQS
jgi:biotin transporter BioY